MVVSDRKEEQMKKDAFVQKMKEQLAGLGRTKSHEEASKSLEVKKT